MKISILVENNAVEPLKAEHGLSMLIEYRSQKLIFDFGKSSMYLENAKKMNIDLTDVKYAFLSHGHNDHTGGLEFFTNTVFCCSNTAVKRFSHHAGKPVKDLSMPIESYKNLQNSKVYFTDDFKEILPGIFSTGKIPRISDEDTGGPFYLDLEKKIPDCIEDESALLFDNGVLIHGCCHSGIINTLEHCRKCRPDIKINTIIGGLHLLNVSEKRLKQTASYLNQYNIINLYLMHCTGINGIDFLKNNLNNCNVYTLNTGDTVFFE